MPGTRYYTPGIGILVLLTVLLAAAPLCAQIERLPAATVDEQCAEQPLWDRQPVLQFPPPAALSDPAAPKEPIEFRDVRSGMFQKLIFEGGWLARTSNAGLGMSDLGLKGVLALPLPKREWPLLITPGFAVHYLDAPSADLPPRVYDAYVQFRWLPKVTPRLLLDLTVTPGLFRDFEHGTSDGLRTTAHLAGVWTWTPTAKAVLGVSYLNRRDLNLLPIGGLLWTPYEDLKADLLFPQPKIAHRIYCFGQYTDDIQDWLYVAGEFGDWIWAIQHTDGVRDVIFYRDIRLLLGVERKAIGQLDWRVEVGYVFGRKISYLTGLPDFEPPGTVMLRGGLTY